MIKIILLTLVCVLSTAPFYISQAQLVQQVERYMNDQDFQALQSFVDKVPVSRDSSIRAYWYPYRQTTSLGWTGSLIVEESRQDPVKEYLSYVTSYRLDIITMGNVIVYSRLLHKQYLNDTSNLFSYKTVSTVTHSNGLSKFKASFQQEYGIKVSLTGLFVDSVYYGDTCLYNDIKTPERKLVEKMVAGNDRKGLYRLLQSPLTEMQFYGVSGFYTLQKQGQILSEKEMMLIRQILQKKGTLKTCGRRQFTFLKTIEEIVTSFKF